MDWQASLCLAGESALLFSLAPALVAGERRHVATEGIILQFNYIDTGIGTNIDRHTAVADGNIDTCGARAVTAATTFDPTAAVRREGKGKASTSHRVITSTTHKPPPPSFSHTADRGELVGLACAVREEWPGCSLLPRAFICVWTCPKSSEWPGVLQQTPHTIRHEPLRDTSRASQVNGRAEQLFLHTLHIYSGNPHNLLQAACQIYDGPHACLVSLSSPKAGKLGGLS
jgi:hypothetical protein